MSRRALLLQRREECAKRIRELGVIAGDPEMEAVESKLRDLSTPALLAALADFTSTIKINFSTSTRPPPNRKAAELHAAFSRQAASLQARHSELQTSARSITEFIGVLDQRKDEAIMRALSNKSGQLWKGLWTALPGGIRQIGAAAWGTAAPVAEPDNKRSKSRNAVIPPLLHLSESELRPVSHRNQLMRGSWLVNFPEAKRVS